MKFVWFALASAGHLHIGSQLVNTLHSMGLRRSVCHMLTYLVLALVVVGLGLIWIGVHGSLPGLSALGSVTALRVYAVACVAFLAVGMPWLLFRKNKSSQPDCLMQTDSKRVHLPSELGFTPKGTGWRTFWLRVPRNEAYDLEVNEKHLQVPKLASALDGFTIAHISDIHLAGTIDRPYYHAAVEEVNKLNADLCVVSGDLVDTTDCVDWLPETLGQLKAKHGVIYIFGNHDKRVDADKLQAVLAALPLTYVGKEAFRLKLPGQEIYIAGDERPWYKHGNWNLPTDLPPEALRVLVAHTPDRFHWACRKKFDLVLAGHTHGGQVCLPVVGPLLAPSKFGVLYAGGTYLKAQTILHVSRGLSSLTPIRWNCPPEVTKLVLRSQQG